jgi:hypothetical protein
VPCNSRTSQYDSKFQKVVKFWHRVNNAGRLTEVLINFALTQVNAAELLQDHRLLMYQRELDVLEKHRALPITVHRSLAPERFLGFIDAARFGPREHLWREADRVQGG